MSLKAQCVWFIEKNQRNNGINELENIQKNICLNKEDDLYILEKRIFYLYGKLEEIIQHNKLLIHGELQSGKTGYIIALCWYSNFVENQYSVVVLRNIKQDKLQLLKRIDEFNKCVIVNPKYFIGQKTIVTLSNKTQLSRVCVELCGKYSLGTRYFTKKAQIFTDKILLVNGVFYNDSNVFRSKSGSYKIEAFHDQPKVGYNLIVDEADLFLERLGFLKTNCRKNYGVTATGLGCIQFYENAVNIPTPKNYKSIVDIDIAVEEDVDKIYKHFLAKKRGIILHNTKHRIADHMTIAQRLYRKYPKLVVLVHNSKGISLMGGRVFVGQSISQILQKFINKSHIAIIARMTASRGVSYVSSDYTRHITDQILLNTKSSNARLFQYIRCCGIFNETPTLWTSKSLKKKILKYYSSTNKKLKAL